MNPQRFSLQRWAIFTAMMLLAVCLVAPGFKSSPGNARNHNGGDEQETDEDELSRGSNETEAEEHENLSDRPDDAARFRRLQLQDEKGFIPSDGLAKAQQQTKRMNVAPRSTIKPDSWSWLGPSNIGGRIRSIVISPSNANNMWVGSVGGGIWRSTDGANSWQPVNDFMANLAVSTMAINPANTNVMYAGTGESFAGDGLQGAGIFNSTDGGLTWNQLASTNPGSPAVCATQANCPWLFVNRLAISPNGGTILAATNNNIQRSTDGGTTWTAAGGVVGTLLDIDFHPTNNQQAISSGNNAGIFSTDGGTNWQFASFNPSISGRVELAYAPSNPSIVYASVNQNNGEVYRSTDSGQTYSRVNTGTNFFLDPSPNASNQGSYDNIIFINPQDPTFVVVGGIDLWRSTDSAATFTRISQWQSAPGSSAHADQHAIVAHPGFNNTSNRIVFFGNDGGIYSANDVRTVAQTNGWVNRNNNLGITQFYGAAGNIVFDLAGNSFLRIIGGAQDNGNVAVTSGSLSWSPIENMGGDGGVCAADPTDSNYFYGEYIYLQLRRSRDGGVKGENIDFGLTDAKQAATANFIAPFTLDPNDPNTMLAGGLNLWRCNNVKSFLPLPLWAMVPKPNPQNDKISAIVVSSVNSNVICVGHNNGDIFITFNGLNSSPTWTRIDTGTPALPDRFVTRLVIDSTRSPSWIYATFGGFNADNVYRSTDLGATWRDITGSGASGLPDVPVRSLVFHPTNPNILYVGTEIGVFTSDNGGTTWEIPQGGPANVSVDELFWLRGELIAVTHGRGIYRASGGTYVDCTFNGVQLGTFEQPFKTITAALNSSASYRTIWIKPCDYNEPAIINQRVELRSLGGTATIRKP